MGVARLDYRELPPPQTEALCHRTSPLTGGVVARDELTLRPRHLNERQNPQHFLACDDPLADAVCYDDRNSVPNIFMLNYLLARTKSNRMSEVAIVARSFPDFDVAISTRSHCTGRWQNQWADATPLAKNGKIHDAESTCHMALELTAR